MISPDKNTAIILAMYHAAVEYLEQNKKCFKENGKYTIHKTYDVLPDKKNWWKDTVHISVESFNMICPRISVLSRMQMFAVQNGQNTGFYITKDKNGLQYHVNRTLQKYLAAGF